MEVMEPVTRQIIPVVVGKRRVELPLETRDECRELIRAVALAAERLPYDGLEPVRGSLEEIEDETAPEPAPRRPPCDYTVLGSDGRYRFCHRPAGHGDDPHVDGRSLIMPARCCLATPDGPGKCIREPHPETVPHRNQAGDEWGGQAAADPWLEESAAEIAAAAGEHRPCECGHGEESHFLGWTVERGPERQGCARADSCQQYTPADEAAARHNRAAAAYEQALQGVVIDGSGAIDETRSDSGALDNLNAARMEFDAASAAIEAATPEGDRS